MIDEYTRAALVHIGDNNNRHTEQMTANRDEKRVEQSYFSVPDEVNDENEVRIRDSRQDLLYKGLHKTVRIVSFPPEVLQSLYNTNRANGQ